MRSLDLALLLANLLKVVKISRRSINILITGHGQLFAHGNYVIHFLPYEQLGRMSISFRKLSTFDVITQSAFQAGRTGAERHIQRSARSRVRTMLAFSLSARAAVATRVATPVQQRRGEFPRRHTGAFPAVVRQNLLALGLGFGRCRAPARAGKHDVDATQTR